MTRAARPKPMTPTYRKLEPEEMDAAAAVHRASFDERLPWLAGRHSAEEDRGHFRDGVSRACDVWGAFDGGSLLGIIAFREGWIDQLYVLPRSQRLGIGRALVRIAQSRFPSLSLWTFQRNERARRFHEACGFVLVAETNGDGNEEREPDALYRWVRAGS
jgi:putative acetyltransferase